MGRQHTNYDSLYCCDLMLGQNLLVRVREPASLTTMSEVWRSTIITLIMSDLGCYPINKDCQVSISSVVIYIIYRGCTSILDI